MFLLGLLIFAPAGFSQVKGSIEDPGTRTLEGVVTDSANHPVANAVVKLKDTKTLQIRSFYSDNQGAYHFAGLSNNVDYEVHADRNGASSATKTLSSFDSHKTVTINLKLK